MSGLALLLSEMGCAVSGSDAAESAVLSSLRAAGVDVYAGHHPSQGASAQIVLWSPAVPFNNAELASARQPRATMLTRAQAMAQLAIKKALSDENPAREFRWSAFLEGAPA